MANVSPRYDVCLSFAGEDRSYVEAVAAALHDAGIRVFYDAYEEVSLWGKDLYQHLANVYEHEGQYCVLFLSEAYARKVWPRHELKNAQARAFKENREYLLPARLDDTKLPGLPETVAYVDLRSKTPQQFAEIIIQKLGARSEATASTETADVRSTKRFLRSLKWQRVVVIVSAALATGAAMWVAANALLSGQVSPKQSTSTNATRLVAPSHPSQINHSNVADVANLRVDLRTSKGVIAIAFYAEDAPNHVRHFISLVRQGFYNQTSFHRIIPGFIVQGGDPNSALADRSIWGKGGAEDLLPAEFNARPHARGTVSMARARDPNSASSQFFICVADVPILDRQYTVFGHVVSGMDVVDRIVSAPHNQRDQPLDPVTIESAVVVYPELRLGER